MPSPEVSLEPWLPSSPPLPVLDEWIYNERGYVRRKEVLTEYRLGRLSLSDIVDCYKEWRDQTEFFGLKITYDYLENLDVGADAYLYARYPELYDGVIKRGVRYRWIKMAKRGNDVYRYRVSQIFKIFDKVQNVVFFDEDWGVKETNMLFVTYTYDTSLKDREGAWLSFGTDFDNHKKKLIHHYGPICVARTWESTRDGYPHVHAIIIFTKHKFPVFVHESKKDGKKKFRIPDADRKKISSLWHSNVDIQGVSNTQGALRELSKYITKDLCSKKGDITNAMLWFFRKQAYSVPDRFIKLIDSNITGRDLVPEVSPDDLIKPEMCNSLLRVVSVEFIGIFGGVEMGVSGAIWQFDVDRPPPKLKKLMNAEAERQHDLKWGRK